MSNTLVGHWDNGSPETEKATIMLARSVHLKIYCEALTKRIVWEVVDYDLILRRSIRSSREVVHDITVNMLDQGDQEFARYFVKKIEQRLLFQLGYEELPYGQL